MQNLQLGFAAHHFLNRECRLHIVWRPLYSRLDSEWVVLRGLGQDGLQFGVSVDRTRVLGARLFG